MVLHAFNRNFQISSALIIATVIMSSPVNAQTNDHALPPLEQITTTTLLETAKGMLVAPAETLRDFRPLVVDHPKGPNIREVEGDPMSGPSITLFRYRNNYEGSRELHTHTYAYRSILIEGEMKHWDANGSEETAMVLRPGSYWRQPGGELHADHCITDHCLALVIFDGPIDANFD